MVSALPSSPCLAWSCRPKSGILEKGNPAPFLRNSHHICLKPQVAPASTFGLPTSPDLRRRRNSWAPLAPKASVGGAEYAVEPETSVKFEKDLTVPGCASSMVLLGTGYREKVFAIIGVKVYAAGFYADPSLKEKLSSWKGLPASELLDDASLFGSLLKASATVKSLKIVLVRDVDGITFWNALNDVISPRIKEPTAVDESALTTFRTTFESRPLTKGTVILLTLTEPSKMLVSISSQGSPSAIDAVIESINVNLAFFDAFFCNSPVSPTLKKSVSNGVEVLLNRP